MTDVLIKRGAERRDTHTQGEGDVRMKAEINQGDDSTHQGTPKITGSKESGLEQTSTMESQGPALLTP